MNKLSISLLIFSLAASALAQTSNVMIYPNPGNLLTNISHLHSCTNFQVSVNGSNCFVYESENYWTNGTEASVARRPQDKVAFTSFGLTNTVAAVVVTFAKKITNAVVRPSGAGIIPVINSNKLSFSISQPTKISVEVNSNNLPLFIIAETPEVPDTNATYYYGPGVYQIGTKKVVNKNESVYIAGGAVVEGTFDCTGTNVSFRGRGILTCGSVTADQWLADNSLCPINYWTFAPKYQTFDGIFMVNSPGWNIYGELGLSTVRNVKMISWVGRSDGIHLGGDSLLEDCLYFINDDCLIGNHGNNNTFRNCVIWRGFWGHAIIALTQAGSAATTNCLWDNNDIIGDDANLSAPLIHFHQPTSATNNNVGGTRLNMVIRNLRIEGDRGGVLVKILADPGDVLDGFHFENISTTATLSSEGSLQSNSNGVVSGVDFLNLRYAGVLVTNFAGTKISIVGTNVATPQILQIPNPPTNLTATAVSTNQIKLTWNDVTSETGFRVWRSQTNGGPYTQVGGDLAASVTNYNDTGLLPVTRYYYVVTAFNLVGQSVNSTQATANTSDDPSLILHWKLDENTGLTTVDAAGRNHLGTLVSSPAWVTGRYGSAVNFTGANYISTPNTTDLQITGQITLTAWVKMNNTTASIGAIISKKDTDINGAGYEMLYLASTGELRVRGGAGGLANATNANLGTNWHHLAAVIVGTNATLYVDAINLTTDNSLAALTASTNQLRIGLNSYGGGGLNGMIDGVEIYNRALNQAEIQSLMLSNDSTGVPEIPITNTAMTNGQMTLNWNNAAFRLYNTTNLTPPANWLPWLGTLTTNGGSVNANIPITGTRGFFRLVWP